MKLNISLLIQDIKVKKEKLIRTEDAAHIAMK